MKIAKIKNTLLAGMMVMLSFLIAEPVQAQKYTVAAGWRAGAMTNGITLKVVPIKGIAVEGTLGMYPYGTSVGGLIMKSNPILCIRALQVYYGVGGHYRFNYQDMVFSDPINGTVDAPAPPGTRGVGVDAVAGIELKIPLLPIAVSAEVKPMIEWTDHRAYFYGLDPGLGIKVVF
ncbi:MAG: hypothetical protein AAF570_27325 [Bacteroidota bacterium]